MPKASIHPTYHTASVTCSCGATYAIGATVESLKLDICRTCHPFYTGNQKLIDTAGRVDRFKAKITQAETIKANTKPKKARKPEMTESQPTDASSSRVDSNPREISHQETEGTIEESETK